MNFAAIQKFSSAICQLSYDNPPDYYDKYIAMSTRECLNSQLIKVKQPKHHQTDFNRSSTPFSCPLRQYLL
ncbi:hypothetical protein QVD17_10231 [Tagetes erecta]|uniref:Uncharacterized protein n=1 Tax=Tagetes erecta TaxID=13708 RepID=A0AAD8P647_TARER|nr:hypothetical protein QVD17_10231 [Tagetes erecta]